jgi:hypothetical protein
MIGSAGHIKAATVGRASQICGVPPSCNADESGDHGTVLNICLIGAAFEPAFVSQFVALAFGRSHETKQERCRDIRAA